MIFYLVTVNFSIIFSKYILTKNVKSIFCSVKLNKFIKHFLDVLQQLYTFDCICLFENKNAIIL